MQVYPDCKGVASSLCIFFLQKKGIPENKVDIVLMKPFFRLHQGVFCESSKENVEAIKIQELLGAVDDD